jgi:hypothetical protein
MYPDRSRRHLLDVGDVGDDLACGDVGVGTKGRGVKVWTYGSHIASK